MSFWDHVQRLYTDKQWFYSLLLIGADLGGTSGAMLIAWLARSQAEVKRCRFYAVLSLCGLLVVIGLVIYRDWLHLSSMIEALAALIVFNAPLQWALVLVILTHIAFNRLRTEEKRAQYDAEAGVRAVE